MSTLETPSTAFANQCAATNTLLNRNKDKEITTMATSSNTSSSESDRTSGSIASIKEHSAMPVYDTAAFDNLLVLVELLNADANDEDECTTWSSIVGANHLVRLRNCDISVQEGTATLQPEPVPIYDVNRSRSLRTSVSLSDLSEMDFDVKSARTPGSGEGEFTTEMEKQPVGNGGKSTDAEQLLPTTLRSKVEETVRLHERGNSRPEVTRTDEVDGDTRTRPSLIKKKSLELLFEYTVTLRARERFSNKCLCARPNRLLQMLTIPGSSLPSEFIFKRRVYKHTVQGMVCSFLSVKHSAFILVTEDKKVMISEDQPLDGYPKPSARFSMSKDVVDHISPVTVTNPKMYVDYNRKTDDVILSEDAKAGFRTVLI